MQAHKIWCRNAFLRGWRLSFNWSLLVRCHVAAAIYYRPERVSHASGGLMSHRILYTIGHSTRSWQEFTDLLLAWKIAELIDVRTIPRSRAFPHFNKNCMGTALPRVGIEYTHIKELGGLRRSKKGSANTGWRNASFRGYADYMQSQAFLQALADFNRRCRLHRTCIMCSEALWWRCHRRMIADAEVARGIPVRHIMTDRIAKAHEMTPFAQIRRGRNRAVYVDYPGSSLAD